MDISVCHIYRLPTELLLTIASFLYNKDLSAWSQASRLFNRVVEPVLYEEAAKYPETPFIRAAETGNVALMRKLRASARKGDEEAILGFAVTEAQALRRAVYKGQTAAVELLLSLGVDSNQLVHIYGSGNAAPLHEAAEQGYLNIANILLEHGADVNVRRPYTNPQTPLDVAASRGHFQMVRFLLLRGADIHAENLIAHAASSGNVDLVRFLLDHGAIINGGRYNSQPSLAWAEWDRNHAMLKLLLERGADPNEVGYGYAMTPLHLAAMYGDVAAVQMLLHYGADVNLRDSRDFVPLHVTADAEGPEREEVYRLLLERDADVFVKAEYGKTPIDSARQLGNPAILDMFSQAIKKVAKEKAEKRYGARIALNREQRV
ncbi:ankyrin repeat-containing domain protein [Aspergillus heterothallicus]